MMRTDRCSGHLFCHDARSLPPPRHVLPPVMHAPCHARSPATHAPPLWTEFLTHACENITFPHLLLRTVTNDFISLPSLCRKCVLVNEIVHQMMVGCKDMFRAGCLSSSLYDILVKWICSFFGKICSFYRPQRSCGQGNIFTPVCHSFCSQGGRGSASVHAGISPWEQTPPQEQTPPRTRPPQEQTPLDQTPPGSRHPPGPDTTPPDQTPPHPDQTPPPPPGSRLQHTVYERPVLILLECILVCSRFAVSRNGYAFIPVSSSLPPGPWLSTCSPLAATHSLKFLAASYSPPPPRPMQIYCKKWQICYEKLHIHPKNCYDKDTISKLKNMAKTHLAASCLRCSKLLSI